MYFFSEGNIDTLAWSHEDHVAVLYWVGVDVVEHDCEAAARVLSVEIFMGVRIKRENDAVPALGDRVEEFSRSTHKLQRVEDVALTEVREHRNDVVRAVLRSVIDDATQKYFIHRPATFVYPH